MSATTQHTPAAPRVPAESEARQGAEIQPWLMPADHAGRHAAARGSGKRRPLAVSLLLDLDAEQSDWLRREARRTGQDYAAILKTLLDRERAARP